MSGPSRFSGTLRGGNVWSRNDFAPKIQHINRADDIGTQGNFTSPVFQWSRVAAPAPGGERHDAVRREIFDEMFFTRSRRAKAVEEEEERFEDINRKAFVREVFGFLADTGENVQQTIKELPQNTERLIVATLYPEEKQDHGPDPAMLRRARLVPSHVRHLIRDCRESADKAVDASGETEREVSKALAASRAARDRAIKARDPQLARKATLTAEESNENYLLRHPSHLQVTIMAGRNFPRTNTFIGKADPYAQCSLLQLADPNHRPQQHTTTVKWNSCDPDWHETFEFLVPETKEYDVKTVVLQVDFWDKEMLSGEDHRGETFIGRVIVPIFNFLRPFSQSASTGLTVYEGSLQRWFDLRSPDNSTLVLGNEFSEHSSSVQLALHYIDGDFPEELKAPKQRAIELAPRAPYEPVPKPHPSERSVKGSRSRRSRVSASGSEGSSTGGTSGVGETALSTRGSAWGEEEGERFKWPAQYRGYGFGEIKQGGSRR